MNELTNPLIYKGKICLECHVNDFLKVKENLKKMGADMDSLVYIAHQTLNNHVIIYNNEYK